MSDDLVEMARLAQHDERMATGALYGDLADRIEELKAKLAQQDDLIKERSDEVQAAVAAALREAAAKTALMPTSIPANPRLAYHAALDAVEQHILALITPDAQDALDRALADQRERDAKVAESVALPMDGRNAKAQADYMSKVIAAAIREGGE